MAVTAPLQPPLNPARHFAVLDGLRGFAVAIVVASHLSNYHLLGNTGLALGGTGKSGVYLFFVLSAFLLTRLLLGKPVATLRSASTWIDYAVRRILRIWPLYLVVLLSSWLISPHVAAWHYRIDTPALLHHLALQEGQSVLWSIPVEFKAYLVLPLIVLGVTLLRGSAAAIAGAFVLLFIAAMMAWPARDVVNNSVQLGQYLTPFIAGAAAAWIDVRLLAGNVASRRLRIACGACVMLVLVAWFATTPLVAGGLTGLPLAADWNQKFIPVFALLWAGMLLALLHASAGIQRLFSNRVMRFLGLVSFSIYLWHMVLVDGWRAAGWPTGPAASAALVAGILVVASVSWWLVERPFRNVRWRPGNRQGGAAIGDNG